MTCFFCRCAVNPIMCLDLKVHFDINTATKHIFSFSIYAFNSILFPIDAISNFFLLYLDMMLLSSTSLDFKNSIWELLLIDESSSLMIITDIFRHFAILFCIFIYYCFIIVYYYHYYAFTLLHFVYFHPFYRFGWVLSNKIPFPLFCVRRYIPFIFFYRLLLNF